MTNPADVVYSPTEIATIGASYLDYRRGNRNFGIPLGLASIDEDLLPCVAGELITIIGRPGNGKTGFMMRWARERAKWLQENQVENKVVVYATWEQSIEELYAFNVAADTRLSATSMARGEISDTEWKTIMASGAKRMQLPLWFIGHSVARRKARPNLTMGALTAGLDYVEHWNQDRTEIDMLFVDYLQRIKFDSKVESKTIGTSDNLDRLKDAGLQFGCPVVVGVQAVRDVDSRDVQVPAMDDGQWTSNIEQASDKVFSVVRPRVYKKPGESFGKAHPMIVAGHEQMLVSLLKQKLGPANKAYWVKFSPEYNKLDELEVRSVNLNFD